MNLNSPIIKGAIMLLLTSLLSVLTNLPTDVHSWTIIGLTTLGTLLIYFGQSFALPSSSESGQLNGKDFLKGLIVAAGNGISTYISSIAEGTPVQWGKLATSVAVLFIGYLIKQWATPSPKA